MISVASIVEGDGEVAALPVLLRRLSDWRTPGVPVTLLKPIRVHRDRFLRRDDEFRRHLLLAANKWMADRMPNRGYHETTDQPAFSAHLDLQQAFGGSRSFRKLCSEWSKHVGVTGV